MSYYNFWLWVFSLNMNIVMHNIYTDHDSYRNHNIHHKISQYDFLTGACSSCIYCKVLWHLFCWICILPIYNECNSHHWMNYFFNYSLTLRNKAANQLYLNPLIVLSLSKQMDETVWGCSQREGVQPLLTQAVTQIHLIR